MYKKIKKYYLEKQGYILKDEKIDLKISGLKERGFKNPLKMINSVPSILGYSFKNIDLKISGLKERGFENPVEMIHSFPSILGYSFKNIDLKIRYLMKTSVITGISFIDVIEDIPVILGISIKKIRISTRIMIKHSDCCPNITYIRNFIFCPVQKLILVSVTTENLSLNLILNRARKKSESISQVLDILNNESNNRLVQILAK